MYLRAVKVRVQFCDAGSSNNALHPSIVCGMIAIANAFAEPLQWGFFRKGSNWSGRGTDFVVPIPMMRTDG
jgi:hypothetical protein